MRIGVDVSCLPHPSLGTYASFLLEALARIDRENEYVLFFNSLRKPMPPLFLADHGRFGVRKLRYPRFSTATVLGRFYVRQVLPYLGCRERVEVFHSPADLPVVGRNFASVLTIHHLNPSDFRGREEMQFLKALRVECRHVEIVIVVSQSTKADVIRILGVPENKIRVTYNGVNHGVYRPVADGTALDGTLRKYALSTPFILYVAGIDRRKNLRTLVGAVALLRKTRGWPGSLVVVGKIYDARYFAEIQAFIDDEGLGKCVKFLGHRPVEEIVHLMNLAAVFVYPSFYEGFGRSALEAMACGCPVVVSRVASLPEVVGDAGLLIDPHSVEECAAALDLVLGNGHLRRELAVKGLNRAQHFTWEKTARETLAAYRAADKSRRAPLRIPNPSNT